MMGFRKARKAESRFHHIADFVQEDMVCFACDVRVGVSIIQRSMYRSSNFVVVGRKKIINCEPFKQAP